MTQQEVLGTGPRIEVDPAGEMAVTCCGDVVISVWKGATGAEQWRFFDEWVRAFRTEQAADFMQVMVVLPTSPPPQAREAALAHFRAMDGAMRHLVLVIVGPSIRQAMVRSIARALLAFVGQGNKLTVCDSLEMTRDLLASLAGPRTPAFQAIRSAVDAATSALDA